MHTASHSTPHVKHRKEPVDLASSSNAEDSSADSYSVSNLAQTSAKSAKKPKHEAKVNDEMNELRKFAFLRFKPNTARKSKKEPSTNQNKSQPEASKPKSKSSLHKSHSLNEDNEQKRQKSDESSELLNETSKKFKSMSSLKSLEIIDEIDDSGVNTNNEELSVAASHQTQSQSTMGSVASKQGAKKKEKQSQKPTKASNLSSSSILASSSATESSSGSSNSESIMSSSSLPNLSQAKKSTDPKKVVENSKIKKKSKKKTNVNKRITELLSETTSGSNIDSNSNRVSLNTDYLFSASDLLESTSATAISANDPNLLSIENICETTSGDLNENGKFLMFFRLFIFNLRMLSCKISKSRSREASEHINSMILKTEKSD
jgi:hypothetical protein